MSSTSQNGQTAISSSGASTGMSAELLGRCSRRDITWERRWEPFLVQNAQSPSDGDALRWWFWKQNMCAHTKRMDAWTDGFILGGFLKER
jgi:hypothetical protein